MKQIHTVTLAQIDDLKWARGMAEDWRGNFDPESYDEFDAWIADVDKAIKAVKRDRKKLRELLTAAEQEKETVARYD